MIDNVRIAAASEREFLTATREFLRRVQEVGATLNDEQEWSDELLLQQAKKNIEEGYDFLGERYHGQTVANTARSVEKLRRGMEALRDNNSITRRQIASVVGLGIFMAHTIRISLASHFDMMRRYSEMFKKTTLDMWDLEVESTTFQELLEGITALAPALISNEPVGLKRMLQPGRSYNAVIVIDACATGWGAYIWDPKSTRMLQQSFLPQMKHSAQAEPWAVHLALSWVYDQGYTKVAVVTDHAVLMSGQRRWWSANGGFSTAFHLNEEEFTLCELRCRFEISEHFLVEPEMTQNGRPRF